MARRRSVTSPLALTVLALLAEQPMHPYEIASEIRIRGIEYSVRLNYGSLYSVVDALRDTGLITARETVREGKRPERTVYAITDAGYAEMRERLRNLLGTAEREYPLFAAGLSFVDRVPKEEAVQLLRQRVKEVEMTVANLTDTVAGLRDRGLPRIAIVEAEYQLVRMKADAAWVRQLVADIESGEVPWERVANREGFLATTRTDGDD